MNFDQMKQLKLNSDAYLKHSYTCRDIDRMLQYLDQEEDDHLRLAIEVGQNRLGLSKYESYAVRTLLQVTRAHLVAKMDLLAKETMDILTESKEGEDKE